MDHYRQRLPSRAQLAAVFAVIVLVLYTWTILWFFWKLPSWLYFLNAGEILMGFAYSLATDLAESLVVLALPVFLAFALPRKWFSDVFVARGGMLALAGMAYFIFLAFEFQDKSAYPDAVLSLPGVAAALVVGGLLVYLAGHLAPVRRLIEAVADRAIILLYILVPLSIVAIAAILLHSLI